MPYPFNGYTNYGYAPYATQYQQQPAQQTQQSGPYYAGRMWVKGRSEAELYPVAPNNAVDLWDIDGRTLYKKIADATGKPAIIECDVIERAQTAEQSAPSYATKDELGAVLASLESTMATIRGEIDGMKGDLYGLAGKKKKKQETEDDE